MINLHAIVRGAVTALHPDEAVTLYQSTGQTNTLGRLAPAYAEPQTVQAQIQSLSAEDLAHMEDASRTEISRKAYLFAPDAAQPPAGIVRPLARGGDMLVRSDGTWWLVTGIIEDFTASGWVCVAITQQVEGPQEATGGD